jgi:hypothetical protein
MRWLTRVVFLCILCVSATARLACQESPTQIDEEHTAWITDVLKAAQTIKVGMTRADLIMVFTTEGGLSTTTQRKYVYRQCPYIKIDVKFAAASPSEELPTDKIAKVSRPYLEWSIRD